MVPQDELDRALARWKARIHGHDLPAAVPVVSVSIPVMGPAPVEEITQVVMTPYSGGESGNVVAEVNLDDGDFEDYNQPRT